MVRNSCIRITRSALLSGVFVAALFWLPPLLQAATINLSGTVVNQFANPVAGAEVALYQHNSLVTHSDAQGHFKLTGDVSTKTVPPFRTPMNGARTDHSIDNTCLYDYRGRKIAGQQNGSVVSKNSNTYRTVRPLATGVYLLVQTTGRNRQTAAIIVTDGGRNPLVRRSAGSSTSSPVMLRSSQATEFSDILVVGATGTQTVRRSVTSLEESAILIRLMPMGAGNVTPGIPVYSGTGGTGDVTTYGSVSDPEYSQGGACNYGTTAIRYYAAINVSQLPGDLQGQWQEGRICGRCARVSVRTQEGTLRTTTVRIVDKCPDDHCGIDLGGAPAGELMGTQAGRYSGQWEWVSCEGVDGVSDGTPSIDVKAGSNSWWSLVHMRNGPGAVTALRARKPGATQWTDFAWGTEAENYFSVPKVLLQDSTAWELAVVWDTGRSDTLRIKGSALAVENASYPLLP